MPCGTERAPAHIEVPPVPSPEDDPVCWFYALDNKLEYTEKREKEIEFLMRRRQVLAHTFYYFKINAPQSISSKPNTLCNLRICNCGKKRAALPT